MTISHVFYFWDCVPRKLEARVAPLRAYRKITQVRLLFRSIRTPEEVQKSIQPDPRENFQPDIRLDFCRKFNAALGNQPLGRNLQSARADSIFLDPLTSVLTTALGSYFCCFIRELAASSQTRISFSLSSFTSSSPLLHSQTLENLHLSHLNLPI